MGARAHGDFMSGTLLGRNTENGRIVLGLLESVGRDSAQSQRRLAAELGIAVGLVNVYLKRCVNKGLLKMAEAPARRYAYYLTPYGFAEKARLTLEYLSYSFDLFRRAKADCTSVFLAASARGFDQVVLAGVSELAEIATICALETGIEIVLIVDTRSSLTTFAGLAVVGSYDRIERNFQAVVVTELKTAQETYAAAVERFGADRVLVPSMLGVQAEKTGETPT
jgi:DNA-binding MarR family transcriptional regulator